MKIYLAGGMKSGWQDRVKDLLPQCEFQDPRSHGLTNPDDYTTRDMQMIRESDAVITYIESTNPGGYNAAFEIGYALGLGKRVLLVDEKQQTDQVYARYSHMIRSACQCFDSLEAACTLVVVQDYIEDTNRMYDRLRNFYNQ